MTDAAHDLSAIFGEHVAHEFVAKDAAAVGLLDPSVLPVTGAARARKVLDKDVPSNTLVKADQPGASA